MAFSLLCITTFIMFFQPVWVFPWLDAIQPLRSSALLALIGFIFSNKKENSYFFNERNNVYFILFIGLQTISASQLWIHGALGVFSEWLKMGIVYYLIVKTVNSERRVVFLAITIATSLVYLSYYSYDNYIFKYVPGQRAGGFGWYENPNDISMIFVSIIPLLMLLISEKSSPLSRIVIIFLTACYAVNILFTASRNGLMGLSVVGILCIYFTKSSHNGLKILLITALLLGVLGVGVRNVLNREGVTGLSGDDSSDDRIIQWKAAGRMVLSHPILGVGPGQFVENAVEFGGIRGLYPHNTVIQVFAETGITGGVAFILFGFLPIFNTYKYIRINKNRSTAGSKYVFISISLCGFWTCALFSNRYQSYILYILVAMSVAVKQNLITKEYTSSDKDF